MAGLLRAPWWLKVLIVLGQAVGAYAVAAVVLGMVPVNRNAIAPADGIEIFLTTNGIHASLVLPLKSHAADLTNDFAAVAIAPQRTHVMVGWGDGRIYPSTGTWADLTLANAATAFFGLNPAVMQAVAMPRPAPSAAMRATRVSDEGFRALADHVRRSLKRDATGRPIIVEGASHGRGDVFYAATGRYQPLYTCNEWVRGGLSAAGVRTPVWSPSDRALFYQFGR